MDLKASYVILDASESSDCCALRMGDIREEVNDITMKEIGIPAIVTRVTLHEMMNARTMPARILTICSMNAPRGWAVAICNSRSCLQNKTTMLVSI